MNRVVLRRPPAPTSRMLVKPLAVLLGPALILGCSPGASPASSSASATTASSAAATSAGASPGATAAGSSTGGAPAADAGAVVSNVVAASQAFLATLDDAGRAAVSLAYPTGVTTATAADFGGRVGEQFGDSMWSNYPISDVIRPGLKLGDLTTAQRDAALAVLQAALSDAGYQKVLDIMGADQVLADAGTNYASGADNYVIGFFGTPSTTSRWMLQFGGHHLGLNVTMQGAAMSMTPTLTGAQPTSYDRDGQTTEPMGSESDDAFALINALDDALKAKAMLGSSQTDLILGPGKDGMVLPPEGLNVAEMSADQQQLLLNLIDNWVGILDDAAAAPRLAQIKADFANTYFAWSGATTAGSSVYFRVTGPTISLEWANQGGGPGGPGGGTGAEAGGVNHVHTVYRDPTNEYGAALGS